MTEISDQRRLFLSSLLAAPLLTTPGFAQESSNYGIVGRIAPELDVEFWLDAEGEEGTFSVLANRGKWIYLKCWQSWCPGCHSSGFPALKKVTDAFADEELVVPVGIQTTFEGHNVNTADKVRSMQLRYELPILMGHDPGDQNPDGYPNTMRRYRTGGTPWQVIIDPNGRVVFDGYHVNPEKVITYFREQVAIMKEV